MVDFKAFEVNTTFATYTCANLIGEGGSGKVFNAIDDKNEKYAIKILKAQGVTSERRKRFKNEIIFCRNFSHPNVIPVIDDGIFDDQGVLVPFYVMPFYDSSLRKLIDGGLKRESILPLFTQLLDGIEAAHQKKVFHRDLKPENILYSNEKNQLVVADFGIARFTEEELFTAVETKARERLANFQYAAPEQRVRNKDVDNRADIYAIGLILNEMFTKEIPQGTGYKSISSVTDYYPYLDEIVEKMIRQNPEDRYKTIDEIKQVINLQNELYLSRQKISKLNSTVIPTHEIDDPLALQPINIRDFDWDGKKLTLFFKEQINEDWVKAFLNMGSFRYIPGFKPEAYRIIDNSAQIDTPDRYVEDLIDLFKSWLPIVMTKYRQNLQAKIEEKENKEREKLAREIATEEARKRLRERIKL